MSTQRSHATAASLLRASARDGVWLPVDGVSMLPTITAGSQVRVVARARAPRLAEIWAFCMDDGTVVVHRFRRRDAEGRYVFRGDNVRRYDPPVPAERLVGAVVAIRSGGKARRVGRGGRASWVIRRGLARIGAPHSVVRVNGTRDFGDWRHLLVSPRPRPYNRAIGGEVDI